MFDVVLVCLTIIIVDILPEKRLTALQHSSNIRGAYISHKKNLARQFLE